VKIEPYKPPDWCKRNNPEHLRLIEISQMLGDLVKPHCPDSSTIRLPPTYVASKDGPNKISHRFAAAIFGT